MSMGVLRSTTSHNPVFAGRRRCAVRRSVIGDTNAFTAGISLKIRFRSRTICSGERAFVRRSPASRPVDLTGAITSCQPAAILGAVVSDRGTLGGLTQFSVVRGGAATARHLAVARADLRTRAEADERVRLESEAGQPHRATPKHLFTQLIQRLPAAECLLM